MKDHSWSCTYQVPRSSRAANNCVAIISWRPSPRSISAKSCKVLISYSQNQEFPPEQKAVSWRESIRNAQGKIGRTLASYEMFIGVKSAFRPFTLTMSLVIRGESRSNLHHCERLVCARGNSIPPTLFHWHKVGAKSSALLTATAARATTSWNSEEAPLLILSTLTIIKPICRDPILLCPEARRSSPSS